MRLPQVAACATRALPRAEDAVSSGRARGNFESASGLSQSTVSAHLSLLQQAGLVTAVKIGRRVVFKRNEVVIRAFIAQMDKGL
ncbi:helix-turn-helix domain-containing protein [Paraburkholderia sediminicola]|uniref:helix-turn-helix domain-containing protein n=1 Tax=Paraburkholderia sediminicola TaxID=458836 RepID=UPI0038B76562